MSPPQTYSFMTKYVTQLL